MQYFNYFKNLRRHISLFDFLIEDIAYELFIIQSLIPTSYGKVAITYKMRGLIGLSKCVTQEHMLGELIVHRTEMKYC